MTNEEFFKIITTDLMLLDKAWFDSLSASDREVFLSFASSEMKKVISVKSLSDPAKAMFLKFGKFCHGFLRDEEFLPVLVGIGRDAFMGNDAWILHTIYNKSSGQEDWCLIFQFLYKRHYGENPNLSVTFAQVVKENAKSLSNSS